MIPLVPFVCLAYFVLYTFALSVPVRLPAQITLSNVVHQVETVLGPKSSLDGWLARQEQVSLEKLLDNVAPGGKNTKDAALGTVIASPSTSSPDYYFQCMSLQATLVRISGPVE